MLEKEGYGGFVGVYLGVYALSSFIKNKLFKILNLFVRWTVLRHFLLSGTPKIYRPSRIQSKNHITSLAKYFFLVYFTKNSILYMILHAGGRELYTRGGGNE